MTKASKSILKEGKSYTFSDYFELNYPTKDIVAEFDYSYELKRLVLPSKTFKGDLDYLKKTYYKRLPHISLTSEIAKREVLIAPLLLELLDHIDIDIDIEYPLNVNEKLKGSIDYFITSSQSFIVVEAEKSDMEKGFSQLAVELIAVDHFLDTSNESIYGAITIGDIWRFGMLDRKKKIIYRDIDSFRVPADLEGLFSVLIGVLE